MEYASSAIGKVTDLSWAAVQKQISYICNWSRNVEKLKTEVDNLLGMKERIQHQINMAEAQGDILLEGVQEWVNKADANISDAKEFVTEEAQHNKTCFNKLWCMNVKTLHHYGRTATKKSLLLVEDQAAGQKFEICVSIPAPTPRFLDLYQRNSFEKMGAQESSLKKIVEALEDENVQIVGVTGLGGVGKTTLATEVYAKMSNHFAEIVFITVSQTVDFEMIQEKVKQAAKRIMKGERVLIILDDLWKELKLEEVGIPYGSGRRNCKILFTSRNRDVCETMDAHKIIPIYPLEGKEAWRLFERVVGLDVWDDNLKEVALNIVAECGGLPLFLQAVGKALRNKQIKSWEAALGRLRNPTDDDAAFKRDGLIKLKLSFDYLESEVTKKIFLMCCMFPNDKNIGLQILTDYAIALEIFDDHDSIQDAKERVQLAIDTLISSSLLLQQKHIKMHDLVRDMAMVITSKGDDKFWVESGRRLEKWQPKKHLERYNKISIMTNEIVMLHHHEFLFPNLDTFLVQDNYLMLIADEFFDEMTKLKVLDISRNRMVSLPRSLTQLKMLYFLNLSHNKDLVEISVRTRRFNMP